ncbi:Qat anti-phage system TatD family nuclease QatD [Caulobacter segnis]
MIDLHCHLDLYPDPKAVVARCKEMGIYVLSVTTTPSAFEGTRALAKGAARIRTGLGLHPQLARERRSELPLFETLLSRTMYVGEIGLDGAPECKPFWDDQLAVFEGALAACQAAGGRVMSLHSRRAATQVLDALERFPGAGTPVFHWFSGSSKELQRAVAAGCWFSVGPAMLSSAKGRALASAMPRDRVLTETDGPFAQIQGKAAFPWDCQLAISSLAIAWGLELDQVKVHLKRNLGRLSAANAV